MCDPVSIGLTLAGTAMQAIGQGQVSSAVNRDLNAGDAAYQAERGRQAGFADQNKATVADTLANYSRPNQDKVLADSTAKRTGDYVSPLQSMSFTAPVVADANKNYAVDSRNQATGDAARALAIKEATGKAALDAYGDAQTKTGIVASDNANKIAETARIASGSAAAQAAQEEALRGKLAADKYAGSTFSTLGQLFNMGGMAAGIAPGGFSGLSRSLFGGSVPSVSTTLPTSIFGGGTYTTPSFATPGMFG